MYALDNVGRNTIAMVPAGGKGERLTPLDKAVDGSTIGYDRDSDLRNGYTVTESGIGVVPHKEK